MNITFIAPPAAGKGLQSSKVSSKYGFPHISIGDLLRKTNDEEVKEKLKSGEFVDNVIVARLLKNRLLQNDCKNGYVLDGFPRNVSQIPIYEELGEINKKKNIIIVLDIPKEIGEKRISGRKVCPNCGEVYNDLFEKSKSKVQGICDKCGYKLIQRSDDSLDVYNHRYDVYLNETAPIIDYFEKNSTVYHVDSSKDADETFKEIEKIIGGYND
jgi:adenylate kinase